ncbi:MAG: ATP synthase F1 subunit epsilon [Bacteroidaceae bacterium]|nr:ATP synthase F1 subunit epsilon [Bacteroidaceae bacterium]MBQ6693979.1 ATP synthase F1 subunit epsilon [Bacteroidaceae bacterium]
MTHENYKLIIMTPEKIVFDGEVASATFPGEKGRFTVLRNHAPLISVLEAGMLRWTSNGSVYEQKIGGGFVEVADNVVTVCAEVF